MHPANLPLDAIDVDHTRNDRFTLDAAALDALIQSVRTHGILVPLLVSPHDGRYRLLAGYRRLEAARRLNLPTVPVVVRPTDSTDDAAVRLAENLDRDNLTPVEEAHAVRRATLDGTIDADTLAARLGRSRAWIEHRLRMADYPEHVLDAVHHGLIRLGVADELAYVADDAMRAYLLKTAIDNGCTVRQAALWREHAEQARNDPTGAPLQLELPENAGAPPVLTYRCLICDQPHPAQDMTYANLCRPCVAELRTARAACASIPAGASP